MRSLTISILFLLPLLIFAQVSFFQENFDNGCATGCSAHGYASSNGVWSVTNLGTNGANANRWYVSCAEDGFLSGPPCANGCSGGGGNATAHIGNVSSSTAAFLICPAGDCQAIYDDSTPAEQTDVRLESPVIDCSQYVNISMDLAYVLGGVNCSTDYLSIEYFDGVIWSPLVSCLPQTTNNCTPPYTGNWNLLYTVNLPASADQNAAVRLGFRWVNDGNGVGTDPSVALNDMVLNGTNMSMNLEQFRVTPGAQDVRLRWTTRSESGVHSFEIQRSADGRNFEALDAVNALGTTETQHTYEWTDRFPLEGLAYYRVAQKNQNGEVQYSEMSAVNFGSDRIFSMEFPTVYSAAEPIGTKIYSNRNRSVNIQVSDMTGRILYNKSAYQLDLGYNSLKLDIDNPTGGWYILQVVPVDLIPGEESLRPLISRFMVR